MVRGFQMTSLISMSQKLLQRYNKSCLVSGKQISSYLCRCSRRYAITSKTKFLLGINELNERGAVPKPGLVLLIKRWCGHKCITHQDCWKCGTAIEPDMEQYFCVCGVVQPPLYDRSYFQIFGLDETFDINPKQLKTKYQKLQTLLHPDRYSQKCKTEQNFSEMHSSLVNKAYHTLQSPLKRGLYLLGIKDEDLEKERESDTELLSETFDLSESIEEANDRDDLAKIEFDNQKNMEELVKVISACFKSGDIVTAKKNLLKLKYLAAAAENIQKRIENLS